MGECDIREYGDRSRGRGAAGLSPVVRSPGEVRGSGGARYVGALHRTEQEQ